MKRYVDLHKGRAFVVTDIHGDWEPYTHYRDHFLHLREQGEADYLIFLGDVVHGYGPEDEDYSLAIVWDIMELQKDLGTDVVIMLLGNHELPHIYSILLSKGRTVFTPRFEASLGEYRTEVIQFFHSLPFYVRTKAGVMLTHAGASEMTARPEASKMLKEFSHQRLLDEAQQLLEQEDVTNLINRTLQVSPEEYEDEARKNLAVTGADDPRYYDLLRGVVASNLEPEWSMLWNFFFSRCEQDIDAGEYAEQVEGFLEAFSDGDNPQNVLVTGHISTRGGYNLIGKHQLRLSSWAHALPPEEGCYLLFDVANPVATAEELVPTVHHMFVS